MESVQLKFDSSGPRCPQNYMDLRYMLRIPTEEQIPEQAEDEFVCLNLDVTMPAHAAIASAK